MRFTVVLCMTADGVKQPPMIIFKNLKKVPKERFPEGMIVTVSLGGSMTSELMKTFQSKVWGSRGEPQVQLSLW